jgi:hypothetical protein
MPSNPFKRSKSPAEQTRDRLDKARRAVAGMARSVSEGADTSRARSTTRKPGAARRGSRSARRLSSARPTSGQRGSASPPPWPSRSLTCVAVSLSRPVARPTLPSRPARLRRPLPPPARRRAARLAAHRAGPPDASRRSAASNPPRLPGGEDRLCARCSREAAALAPLIGCCGTLSWLLVAPPQER